VPLLSRGFVLEVEMMGLEPTTPCLQSQFGEDRYLGRMTDGAGRSHRGLVRGCPLRTDRGCCEWHGSGTSDEETTFGRPAASGISPIVAQGPSPADAASLASLHSEARQHWTDP
jgi:hypothetical protein